MKRGITILALVVAAAWVGLRTTGEVSASEAGDCVTCHKEKSPGIYQQWQTSRHAAEGVGCVDCHGAKEGEPDAFGHEGVTIATLVTPRDCAGCHEQEAREVESSYHATAGEILESNDAYLAHVAGGEPVVIMGCESCHGSKVRIDPESPNKLSKKSWPNSGIGRLNPDGSKGSCVACHTRHTFSKAQARQPEACAKCHLGPDHPQKEVYEESKHGNAYFTNIDKMNLESDEWVVGKDYSIAPTCATCHMSAAPGVPVSHDVGQRISWTLRPPVSKYQDNWEEKRERMSQVCSSCHASTFVDGFYYQFDGLVGLYNEKFAKPATDLMKIIREKKLLENPAAFSNKIEWIYWEIWHHEGRRARHGAAMMGPDYTWWHGIYEVAQHFYFKLIPEARKLQDKDVDKFLDALLKDPMHSWTSEETEDLRKKLSSGELQKMYQGLYSVETKKK